MTSVKEKLWLILEDLREDEFKQLKWILQQADIMHTIVPRLHAYAAIPAARLEKADRQDTVARILQVYGRCDALEVTTKVLIKINRNDLMQRLADVASEPTVDFANASVGNREALLMQSQAVLPHLISTDSKPEDLTVPVPKPPRLITAYQHMLRSNLQNRCMCVQEGLSNMEDKKLLDDIYTELYITDGGDMQINRQHEVRQVEMISRKPAEADVRIKPSEIFKYSSGRYRPIRTVLTTGIAGIGKTFLVHKFILDWAEGRSNQDVHLIFPFCFRQLNLLKRGRFSLAEMIHKCIMEAKPISEEALNYIFAALQMSGNTNYDKSTFKLLFVLDGLDENRLQLDLTAQGEPVCDVTESTRVEVLLMNLINGALLPSARVWITTRPAAANQISQAFVDMVSEVRGFTDSQKDVYFTKRFSCDRQAHRIISHIKASRSLHIMCHIPVFCWITATVLEDLLETSERKDLPKTLTEMYTEFLAFQMKQTQQKYGCKKSLQYIQSLAKLAFHQLEKGNLVFYEKDLKETGFDVSEASVYSGVFTQIFKKERQRKKDKVKGHMFSFVHLSIQEFLAALHVELCLSNRNKNVMVKSQPVLRILGMLFSKPTRTQVHKTAIDKALESPDGHLDLFLRFLLGFSLQTNQDFLAELLGWKKTSSDNCAETVEYIKENIKRNPSPERSINLFHCLNELNDHSLVEEIQQYLNSETIARRYLTPAQWSALVFILQSSEKQHEVFDLKQYSASEEGLLRLLPVFQSSNTYLLSGCQLSKRSFQALSSVLSSSSNNMKEMDLSSNNPEDTEVKLLSEGLRSPHCQLKSLRLSDNNLSDQSCDALASVLCCQSSVLHELDLSNNDLKDSGVTLLCAALGSLYCPLALLRLNLCKLTWISCEALASVLGSPSSRLKQLDLDNNDLQDSGVKCLCVGLKNPQCRLESLSLSGCMVTEEGCACVASALGINTSCLRELDLSYNHPGDPGVQLLSARLQDPGCKLTTLRLDHCGACWLISGLQKYACDLTLEPNTAHTDLVFSEENRRVYRGREEQPYPAHPDHFDGWFQLLCSQALTGRCYFEVEWDGRVVVALTYRGIRRSGEAVDCLLGWNDKAWSLECTEDGYYSWHKRIVTNIVFHPLNTTRVSVYVDWPGGVLSFYRVSDTLTHLHTFYSTFTEPLCPGFKIGLYGSMTLRTPQRAAAHE